MFVPATLDISIHFWTEIFIGGYGIGKLHEEEEEGHSKLHVKCVQLSLFFHFLFIDIKRFVVSAACWFKVKLQLFL